MAAEVGHWSGVESDALLAALDITVEKFAALVEVSESVIYRWKRAGAHANIRRTNQRRLTELFENLDDAARQHFWAEVTEHAGHDDEQLGIPITSTLSPAALSGYWVTCFKFDRTRQHVDISRITPHSGRRVMATNYPPSPRSEARTPGFRNEISAELINRHLIGRWWNCSDNYFFGALHLAVLPGETVLDGFYTGFPHDGEIVAERWKWARLVEDSLSGSNLDDMVMKEPELVYALVDRLAHTDSQLSLDDVAEAR